MDIEVMKEYTKKVIILVLAVVMLSATAAGIVFSLLKGIGLYPNVSWGLVAIFIGIVVIEDIIGVILIKKSLLQKERLNHKFCGMTDF